VEKTARHLMSSRRPEANCKRVACGPAARLRKCAHGQRRIPTLVGWNTGVRLHTAVSGLGQGPTASAHGQSVPGLRTPPAKTRRPRAKTAQETAKIID